MSKRSVRPDSYPPAQAQKLKYAQNKQRLPIDQTHRTCCEWVLRKRVQRLHRHDRRRVRRLLPLAVQPAPHTVVSTLSRQRGGGEGEKGQRGAVARFADAAGDAQVQCVSVRQMITNVSCAQNTQHKATAWCAVPCLLRIATKLQPSTIAHNIAEGAKHSTL
jgi:hypothetical protein